MENNLQNRGKYFAQYFGQKAIVYPNSKTYTVGYLDLVKDSKNHRYLLLTPLSNISDEDAIEVAKIRTGSTNHQTVNARFGRNHLEQVSINDNVRIYQYLQSKGYALPYHDLSVEQLVEYGWIELAV